MPISSKLKHAKYFYLGILNKTEQISYLATYIAENEFVTIHKRYHFLEN